MLEGFILAGCGHHIRNGDDCVGPERSCRPKACTCSLTKRLIVYLSAWRHSNEQLSMDVISGLLSLSLQELELLWLEAEFHGVSAWWTRIYFGGGHSCA